MIRNKQQPEIVINFEIEGSIFPNGSCSEFIRQLGFDSVVIEEMIRVQKTLFSVR